MDRLASNAKDPDLELMDYEASVNEVWRFKGAGAKALVDEPALSNLFSVFKK